MVERTNEQQKMLEKRKADLAERRRIELETAQQLEAQEEMGEELGKTYTSLQQEVLIDNDSAENSNFIQHQYFEKQLKLFASTYEKF